MQNKSRNPPLDVTLDRSPSPVCSRPQVPRESSSGEEEGAGELFGGDVFTGCNNDQMKVMMSAVEASVSVSLTG